MHYKQITTLTNYKNKCSFSAVIRNRNNGVFDCGKHPKLFLNMTYTGCPTDVLTTSTGPNVCLMYYKSYYTNEL